MERKFSGWRGVTDPSGSLVCVSYEPIEGTLACRFKSLAEAYIYEGVPEAKYQVLISSPYAGTYFRKQIKDKYPCVRPDGIRIPAKMYYPDAPKKKLEALSRKRLEEVPVQDWGLFGPIHSVPKPTGKRSKSSSTGGSDGN
jgi:hypothetical protein